MLGISKSEVVVCVFMCFGVIWGPQSHTYTSYNKVRKGLSTLVEIHVHVWSCLSTHVAIQTERCSWRTQYMCAVPFGSHCIIPSHCTLNWLLLNHNKVPCLWNESHIALNHASLGLSPEFTLRNSASIYQHTQHFRWQQNTRQNIMTNENWEHSTVTSSKPALETKQSLLHRYLGLILGINRPEGEAHHYTNKCGPAVTLPRQSLSLIHVTNKQTK